MEMQNQCKSLQCTLLEADILISSTGATELCH